MGGWFAVEVGGFAFGVWCGGGFGPSGSWVALVGLFFGCWLSLCAIGVSCLFGVGSFFFLPFVEFFSGFSPSIFFFDCLFGSFFFGISVLWLLPHDSWE